MQRVDEAVVRRSNALADFAYGVDFGYRETISTGKGLRGLVTALLGRGAVALATAILVLPPTRALVTRFVFPPKGGGPRSAVEGDGSFRLRMLDAASGAARVTVEAELDPGYAATAVMIGEAALLLAEARRESARMALPSQGGVLTPAAAFGRSLAERIDREGVHFREHHVDHRRVGT
jgi:short subunit dehydrogenase-like uncharacterized protein